MSQAFGSKHFDSVCRLCLEKSCVSSIFDHDTIDIVCLIKLLTQLEITNDDAHTKLICMSCKKFLESVVKFREKCIQSYKALEKELRLTKDADATYVEESNEPQGEEDFHLEFIEFASPPQADRLATNGTDGEKVDRLYCESSTNSKDMAKIDDHLEADKIKLIDSSIDVPGQHTVCPLCGEHVPGEKIMLKYHIKSDHGDDGTLPKIRQCFFCQKAYSSYQLLKYHLYFHPQQMWQCPQCDKRIEKKGIFIDHLRMHANERHHECRVCGKRFTTLQYLSTHRKLHKVPKASSSFNSSTDVHQIRTTNDNEQQSGRTDATRTEHSFHCGICPESFHMRALLNIHLHCDHVPLDESMDRSYGCNVCTKTYVSAYHLNVHMQHHAVDEMWPCTDCSMQFRSKTELKEHEQTHSQRENFLCIHCGREFPTSRYLKRHLQSHKKEKPSNVPEMYECEICGKQMKFKSNYTNHRKSHKTNGDAKEKKDTHICPTDGEQKKVYLCNICGHNCGSSSNLIVHLRRHNGQSVCQCAVCGKGYPRKSDLVMHMRIHTGEKPFECTSCGRRFSRRDKLRIHIRTHTGEKPYACPCGRAYAQKNDLKSHQKRNICGQNFDMSKLLAPHTATICIKSPERAKSPPSQMRQVEKTVHAEPSSAAFSKDPAEVMVEGDVVVDMVDNSNWAHFMSATFPKPQDNAPGVDFDPMPGFSSQPKLYS